MSAVPVPVVIVGGFLGAGKTSLVNHLVVRCRDRRVAALVNDFSAINIDAGLVAGIGDEVLGLANGCICCVLNDELIATALRLLRRSGGLDLMIIEASGASQTMEVANAFLRPELRGLFEVSAVLGMVDAAGFGTLDGEVAALARAQLAAADIVVLNKIDLVDAAALATLRASVHETVPGARIVQTSHGAVPPGLVLDGSAPRTRPRFAARGSDGHPYLDSFVWESERPLALSRLRDAFGTLPDGLYRAKGFIHLADLPGQKILLQMVGQRSSLNAMGAWNGETPTTRIVMIGAPEAIDSASLQASLDSSTADPAVRSPLAVLASRIFR